MLTENQHLKQKIHSLNTETILLKQKVNYLNQLFAENTMKYRNFQSSNENLQMQFHSNNKLFLKQLQTEKSKYNLLEKKNKDVNEQLQNLKITHELILQENIQYQQQNKSLNETCKENEKLRKQNSKYENDLKSIQKQHTKEITALNQVINELREQLETQSSITTAAAITIREPINHLQNLHSNSVANGLHSTSNSKDNYKPMIRPILSNSATNYSNSVKVRLYNFDSNGNVMLSSSRTIGTPSDTEQKLVNDIYTEMPDMDYDCLQIVNAEIFDCDIGITKGDYNALYPFLCKVFIENTGCCRVPKKSDLETIILKHGATKTTTNDTNKYTVTIKEKVFAKFWQWFKTSCTIVKELSYLWDVNQKNMYLCDLFCGREQSKEILHKQGNGTFIIRLATSRKDGIVFSYFEQISNKIIHSLYIRKGTNQYASESNVNSTRALTVSEIVRRGKFRFMYTPNRIHPKNNVF